VITDALVHRLLLSGGRCTAVQDSVDGKLAIAECAGGGEVVLAAGEYKSLFSSGKRRPPRSTAYEGSDGASHSHFRDFCRE
jgi:hypothetical protein